MRIEAIGIKEQQPNQKKPGNKTGLFFFRDDLYN